MNARFVRRAAMLVGLPFALVASPAAADEIAVGYFAHGVGTPFTLDADEGGNDIQVNYRFDPLVALSPVGSPEPYLIGSLNLDGDTSFAGAGVAWKVPLGGSYLRPGIGLVVHDGPELKVNPETGERTDLGSRILFQPEVAIGVPLGPKLAVEGAWVHVSNAQIFDGDQNPGIDTFGVRAVYKF